MGHRQCTHLGRAGDGGQRYELGFGVVVVTYEKYVPMVPGSAIVSQIERGSANRGTNRNGLCKPRHRQ